MTESPRQSMLQRVKDGIRFLAGVARNESRSDITPNIKRVDEKEDKVDESHDERREEKEEFEGKSIKLQPALTIPLKNAIIQELQPIDRHEAAAATSSRLQDPGLDDPGVSGEIVYEDELGGELSDWMPPPPPPPPELTFRRRPFSSLSSSSSALSSLFQPGTSTRLFGDDFALFLVILTIAGFFGLMLAMFMPFTFLMQQQLPVGGYPVGIGGAGLGGYPGAGIQSGYGGYPPYGRRRRRRKRSTVEEQSIYEQSNMNIEDHFDLEMDFIRIMAGINEFVSNYNVDSDPENR